MPEKNEAGDARQNAPANQDNQCNEQPHYNPDDDRQRPGAARRLLEIARPLHKFHNHAGKCFVQIQVDGHVETWPTNSARFGKWLRREFRRRYNALPNTEALKEAVEHIEAEAELDGPEQEVYCRVAERDRRIYVDLVDDKWRVIEIDAEGWRILDRSPVPFVRWPGMLALPEPEQGGSIESLWNFINVTDEEDKRLIVGHLLASLSPKGPYFLLALLGEQGSAKSTAARLSRHLIDPNANPLRSLPRREEDLLIAANHSWVVTFDNVSHITPWMSDALCRLSTGGGTSKRKNYTDGDEHVIDAQRPVIVNGIGDIISRNDLLDRALVISLPEIPAHNRRTEREIRDEFEKVHPAILGGLLDALSGSLRDMDKVQVEDLPGGLPRMADAALRVTAAEPSLEWPFGTFVGALHRNRKETIEIGLELNPVATAMRSFMKTRHYWEGNHADLLENLNPHAGEYLRRSWGWPKEPRKLSNEIERIKSALRQVGIVVERLPRANKKRPIRITKIQDDTVTTDTSVTDNEGDRDDDDDGDGSKPIFTEGRVQGAFDVH